VVYPRFEPARVDGEATMLLLLAPLPQGEVAHEVTSAAARPTAPVTMAPTVTHRPLVMAACKSGCDELVERGFVTIADDCSLRCLRSGSQAHSIECKEIDTTM
jgi:hypothetical protein